MRDVMEASHGSSRPAGYGQGRENKPSAQKRQSNVKIEDEAKRISDVEVKAVVKWQQI
jgi:hypothetical protein